MGIASLQTVLAGQGWKGSGAGAARQPIIVSSKKPVQLYGLFCFEYPSDVSVSGQQPGLHVNGDDTFVRSADEVPVGRVAQLGAVIAAPRHGGFGVAKTEIGQQGLNFAFGLDEADGMRLDVALRGRQVQFLLAPEDAFKRHIVTGDKIALAQPPQVARRGMVSKGPKTGIAGEGRFPDAA